jgi:hypothetical protein
MCSSHPKFTLRPTSVGSISLKRGLDWKLPSTGLEATIARLSRRVGRQWRAPGAWNQEGIIAREFRRTGDRH